MRRFDNDVVTVKTQHVASSRKVFFFSLSPVFGYTLIKKFISLLLSHLAPLLDKSVEFLIFKTFNGEKWYRDMNPPKYREFMRPNFATTCKL